MRAATAGGEGQRVRPLRRQLARNVLFSGGANLWAMVVSLISLPLMLHGLGAVGFGLWALLETFSAGRGWLSLADLGTRVATAAEVARHRSLGDTAGASRAMASALCLLGATGAGCGGALACLGPRWLPGLFGAPAGLRSAMVIAIVALGARVPLEMLSEGTFASLEGLQRIDLARCVDAVQRTLMSAAAASAALLTASLAVVGLASLAATGLGLIVAVAVLWSAQALVPPSWAMVQAIFSFGWVVGGSRAFTVVHRNMDRCIVGVVLGPAPVSLVEIATQVQNGVEALLSAAEAPVVPAAAWLAARSSLSTLRELFLRGTKYAVLVAVPLAAGGALLARPLVEAWVGPRYGAAESLIPLAMAYMVMVAPIRLGSLMLSAVGRARDVLKPFALATVVNLAASILLVRAMGVAGTFVGTLIGTAFFVVPLARMAPEEVGATYRDLIRTSVWPAAMPTAILALILLAMPLFGLSGKALLAAGVIGGGAVYCTMVLLVALGRAERRDLWSLVRRTPPLSDRRVMSPSDPGASSPLAE
ncbi:MAG TPA: oligosaccharide flippase family protein [Candidatus Binatia bacterium]|nr:oligosaccharide flippase family protein [Candidatus Binatia bacterium]